MRTTSKRDRLCLVLLGVSTVSIFMVFQSLDSSSVQNTFLIANEMGSKNVIEVVQPFVNTIISQPCNPYLKGPLKKRRPFGVILVTSLAESFDQRNFIRRTWSKWADKFDVRVFFMMGFSNTSQPRLLHEQNQYDDLIIDEYIEGYYKLTGKVLRMLKWYNSTYPDDNSPTFFVKTDEDVFVNMELLVSILKNTTYYKNLISGVALPFNDSSPDSYYVGGRRLENAEVIDDPSSKFYLDPDSIKKYHWPEKNYPTYAHGQLYIFSGNIVRAIYEASFNVPVFPFEDVYVLGMLANSSLNLHISNIQSMWRDGTYFQYYFWERSTVRKIMAIHPVNGRNMINICGLVKPCYEIASDGSIVIMNSYMVVIMCVGVLYNSNRDIKVF